MNIVLWILQVLFAVAFLGHGWLFVAPPPDMVAMMDASLAPWLRIFIGIAELLGAAGLILPGLTRIMPQLTVWAATGLATIVGLATILHLVRGEYSSAATTLVLCLLTGFVAYMRWHAKPLPTRDSQPQLTI
jgi:putative oxidoreductase